MLYSLYEMQRQIMAPARLMATNMDLFFSSSANPWAHTQMGKMMQAGAQIFEEVTRPYGKPEWGLDTVTIDGKEVAVTVEPHIERTFGTLMHFKRDLEAVGEREDPKLLVVAPMSGHFATLLRGTVEEMLPDHEVFVTDWNDARHIPLHNGRFTLNSYIDYIMDFLHYLGPNTHVMAVCQPAVPVLAAVSIMSSWNDGCVPASMTLMGGPIDTRSNPTAVNKLAQEHDMEWFERNVIQVVPGMYEGRGRRVYPGFIQLTNFISMNFDRHMQSYAELFDDLVKGDDETADKRRAFYNEYLSVMDIPAGFYLQTVDVVFKRHLLPKGEMKSRWRPVDPSQITKCAILCVEGELDDISGVGQTKATLDLATELPAAKKHYHLEKGVGHYGVFNGAKWRRNIAPTVKAFIREHDTGERVPVMLDAAD